MSQKQVTIYTKPTCPYCIKAKALLDSKSVTYHEIDILALLERRNEMIEKSGRTTVPQIFIGEAHVGGCDDLHALEAQGKLNEMLIG